MDSVTTQNASTYATELDGEPNIPVLLDEDGGVRIIIGTYAVEGVPVALYVRLSAEQLDQLYILHENYTALISGELPLAMAA